MTMAEPKSSPKLNLKNLLNPATGAVTNEPVASAADAVDISGDILDVESLDVSDSPFGPSATFEDIPLIGKPEKHSESKAKGGPPTADEWQSFFARFVVRGITRGYIALVLRDLEDQLSEEDKARIRLTDAELNELAAPMAGFSTKNAFLKKHGRTIVSSAESSEVLIGMFFWMRRVNKIAKRYRDAQPIQGTVINSQYETVNERVDDGGFYGSDDGNRLPGPRYGGQYFPGTSG